MLTPRPYLSFSSMTLFERSPEEWCDYYLFGKKPRISRNMAYGSLLADGLEAEEATGDPALDLMMAKIPKFERMDKPVEGGPNSMMVWYERDKKNYLVPVLLDKNGNIPLLAVPDTAKADYSAFKEYKTSVRDWTQRMADDSAQITFYATAIWLKTKKIPQDIELVDVRVAYQDDFGRLAPTGEMLRFLTKRTLADVIKMTARIRKNWHEIKKLCEEKLL